MLEAPRLAPTRSVQRRLSLIALLSLACTSDPEASRGLDSDEGSGGRGGGAATPTSGARPDAPSTNAGSSGASGHGGAATGPASTPASTASSPADPPGPGAAGAGGASSAPGAAGLPGAEAGAPTTPLGGAGPDSGSAGSATGLGGSTGQPPRTGDFVRRTASTYTFRHFPIETGPDGVWTGGDTPGTPVTSTTFDTVILENGTLRVTLLPDYGGRILSIVHKPTDTELLYQNPVGTPYLMHEGIFYFDYLVILGGIFPSFPEPEHGRYWNQPYEFDVLSESAGAITVRMSRRDDQDVTAGVPESYDVGRTDVLVALDVTLRAGSAALELTTTLTNTRDTPIGAFEYWTVTTLAPGSTPGETAIPLDTRIVADMERVRLLESSWPWFGDAEQRIEGEVFAWNNLAHFENWVDQGTAFANPEYGARWSGLINQSNDMGILRVSENVETPGLKLWTFGPQSLSVDLDDGSQWLRPTIEMWHGITPEFWSRGTLAAGEVRSWTDHYFPTLGLREITSASQAGALQFSRSAVGADVVLAASATLTLPGQTVLCVLRLDGAPLVEQEMTVAPDEPTVVSVTVPDGELAAGSVLEAEFSQAGTSLLSGQLVLE